MPADTDPATPRRHAQSIVHAQGDDGRSAHSGQADNLCAIGAPSKVFSPYLGARVKEGNAFTGQRIFCLRPGSFELVAAITGQPEIGQSCFTAFRPWNNMINSHWDPGIGFRGQAIAAAMPAFFRQFLAQASRDVELAHPTSLDGSGEGN
jgi:hypothetical protein